MYRFILPSFILLISQASMAQNLFPELDTKNNDCKLRSPPVSVNNAIAGVPDYGLKFILPASDSNQAILTVNGKNQLMDIDFSSLNPIPGNTEAIPTPDGKYILSTSPKGSLQIFAKDDLSENSKPIYDDNTSVATLMGKSSSIAILNTGEILTYRVLSDSYSYQDFVIKDNVVVVDNEKPKSICANLPREVIRTPVLSKDGKLLSAYNPESGTTVIYEQTTDGSGNSSCLIKRDLGFATSSVDFSPDGSKITFAMNSFKTNPSDVDWNKTPDAKTQNFNVFVYDFASDEISRISASTDGNKYSPVFSDNESVSFLEQEGDKYFYQNAKVSDAPGLKLTYFTPTEECPVLSSETIQLEALGKLWESICSNYKEPMTMATLAMLPLGMSEDSCSNLVITYWDMYKEKNLIPSETDQKPKLTRDARTKPAPYLEDSYEKFYLDQFLKLNESDLLQTCKSLSKEKAGVVKMTSFNVNLNKPLDTCVDCHTGDTFGPYIPFDKPAELSKFKEKMKLQVMTGNMPKVMTKSEHLEDDERAMILEALEKIPDP